MAEAHCRQSLQDLNAQLAVLSNVAAHWNSLQDFFDDLAKSLQAKADDLVRRRMEIEALDSSRSESLDHREQSILAREESSLARIRELKDLSLASVAEQREKWFQECKEKVISSLGEATTAATAVAEVAENQPMVPEEGGKTNPLQDGSDNQAEEAEKEEDGKTEIDPASNGCTVESMDLDESGKREPSETSAKAPELLLFAQLMDGEGMANYLSERRKDIYAIRQELLSVLHSCVDPARLVIKALLAYPSSTGIPYRRACVMLLESLSQALAVPGLKSGHPVIPASVRKSAKEVAQILRSVESVQSSGMDSPAIDAQAFLQFLATFNIASEYSKDELCKVVMSITNRRLMPTLCRSLDLAEKMPELVNKLAKEGRQIEALGIANAFGFIEEARPVELLKDHLRDAKKTVGKPSKKSGGQNDAIVKELAAVRAVVKAVEEFKLQSKYPDLEGLKKQIPLLEQQRVEKKRAAVAAAAAAAAAAASAKVNPHHHANKKRRAGIIGNIGPAYATISIPPSLPGKPGSINSAALDRRLNQTFDRAVYGGGVNVPAFSVGAQTAALANSYMYPVDTSVYPANAVYGNSSASYGNQQFGNPTAQPGAAYQPYHH